MKNIKQLLFFLIRLKIKFVFFCIFCQFLLLTGQKKHAKLNKSYEVNLEVDRLLVCLAVFKTVVKG